VKLTVGEYRAAVKPVPAFKNFLCKRRWIAFVLIFMILNFSASSKTYLPLYTQTNSFEQYTSFISVMLGAKPGNVFVEVEKEKRNWVGGKVFAPGILCPTVSSPFCLTSGTTTTATNAWNPTINPDPSCTDASPVTSSYTSSGTATVTPATGTSLNGTTIGVGSTTIRWTAIDGCGNTATCSYSVIVYGVPASPLSAGVINGMNNVSACVGFAVSVALDISSPSPSGGTPPYSYQWQLNGTPITGATSPTYTPPPFGVAGIYNYTAVITDACGRIATTPQKTFTILADPTISISGGGPVCLNGASSITAIVNN
jgi:hypothetical protein